jgi:hypothetical protein
MNRTELINYLLDQRNGQRYLEIGVCNEQDNFAHIRCAHKVGVDVRPVTVFQGTSDQFFAQNREEFDLIFIDGFHTEEQTLKDIFNAEWCLATGGAIVLHDCMPPDAWHQREPEAFREGESWNGTVWKAALRVFNHSTHRCVLLDMDWGCGVIDTAQTQVPARRELPAELDYEQHYAWLLEYKTSVASYLRERVAVFYHLACINDWRQIFAEQLQQLQRNGFRRINLTVLGTAEDLQTVNSLCEESNVGADIIFHAPELTHFERPALLAVEEYARHHEAYALYLHGKGVSSPHDETKGKWRRLMMRELVENWEHCVQQLPHYDLVGVNWREMPPISHFSGNFWYASTKYLRGLANFARYYEDPDYEMYAGGNDRRLRCEFWIGSGRETPRVLSLVCRDVDFCSHAFWDNQQP